MKMEPSSIKCDVCYYGKKAYFVNPFLARKLPATKADYSDITDDTVLHGLDAKFNFDDHHQPSF